MQGTCCTAFVDGQRAISAPDLEKLLQAAAAHKTRPDLPDGTSNDTMQHFPFDHIYKHVHAAGDPFPQTHSQREPASDAAAEAEGKGATIVVLYGMIGTSCFRDMHALLASGVRDSNRPGMPAVHPMCHPPDYPPAIRCLTLAAISADQIFCHLSIACHCRHLQSEDLIQGSVH